MLKIYYILDNTSKLISNVYLGVNLSSIVRDLRAICDQERLQGKLVLANQWNDSTLFELTGDSVNGFKVTGKFELKDITGMGDRKPIDIKNSDILEDKLHGK